MGNLRGEIKCTPFTAFRRRDALKYLFAIVVTPPTLRLIGAPLIAPAHAVDPLTAITIAQTTLSVIDGFTAKGDGGLSATLQAQLQYLELISQQVDQVILSLGQVQASLSKLPEEVRRLNELDRMIGYYDRIRALGNTFREKFASGADSSRRELRALRADYKRMADDVQELRGSIGNYHSLVPAMAAPLSLAIEIAARRRSGELAQIRPALDHYQLWVEAMVDRDRAGSVAAILQSLLDDHATKLAALAGRLQGGDAADWAGEFQREYGLARCTRPKVWAVPTDINLQNESGAYAQILVSLRHQGRMRLTVLPDPGSGILKLGAEPLAPMIMPANASDCSTVEIASVWRYHHPSEFTQSLDPQAYDPLPTLVDMFGSDTAMAGGAAQASNEVSVIEAELKSINALRVDIGVYAQAVMICHNVLTRVQEHRGLS